MIILIIFTLWLLQIFVVLSIFADDTGHPRTFKTRKQFLLHFIPLYFIYSLLRDFKKDCKTSWDKLEEKKDA